MKALNEWLEVEALELSPLNQEKRATVQWQQKLQHLAKQARGAAVWLLLTPAELQRQVAPEKKPQAEVEWRKVSLNGRYWGL